MPRYLVTAVSALALLAAPKAACAQTILGWVLDDLTEASVSTVAIMLLDSTDVAVGWAESDSVGRFFMRAPRPGVYRLYADRMAYGEILSESFRLEDERSVELLLRMVPVPLELESVVVTAERRRLILDDKGFYKRRDRSMGHFFDPEDIQLWDPSLVTDVMRNVPGVFVRRSRLGGNVALTRRLGRDCPMKVILDGFKVDVSNMSLDDIVHPDRLIGMEIYPSGVGAPVQYRGTDSRCGIVMIWTR